MLHVIRAMKHVNNRFYNEIIRTNNIELDMLKFFKDYKFILAPLAKRIDPEFSLDRKYFIDFVTFDNDDVKLIELESPNENIFINNRKSKIFIDSINQVKDWFDWIEENSNRANDLFDQNLPRTAFIIIGKKEFHNQVEIQNIQNFNLKENKIELFTYDDLHFQFSLFIKRMEEQLKIEDTSSTI